MKNWENELWAVSTNPQEEPFQRFPAKLHTQCYRCETACGQGCCVHSVWPTGTSQVLKDLRCDAICARMLFILQLPES